MNNLDELYQDICDAAAYFEDAIRKSAGIIAECEDEDLAKELGEQRYHFQTALSCMMIQRLWLQTADKKRRPGCCNTRDGKNQWNSIHPYYGAEKEICQDGYDGKNQVQRIQSRCFCDKGIYKQRSPSLCTYVYQTGILRRRFLHDCRSG